MDLSLYSKWFKEIDEWTYREFIFSLKEVLPVEITALEMDIFEGWATEHNAKVEVQWIYPFLIRRNNEKLVRNRIIIYSNEKDKYLFSITKGEDDYYWIQWQEMKKNEIRWFKCDDIQGVVKLLDVISSELR